MMTESEFEDAFDTGYDSAVGDIQFQLTRLYGEQIDLEAFLDAIKEWTINEL